MSAETTSPAGGMMQRTEPPATVCAVRGAWPQPSERQVRHVESTTSPRAQTPGDRHGRLRGRHSSTLAPSVALRRINDLFGGSTPTTYNGTTFRSFLEARWAALFDGLAAEWGYEPVRYLIRGVPYTPDFAIPSMKWIMEVKPNDWALRTQMKYTAAGVDLTASGRCRCFVYLVGEPKSPATEYAACAGGVHIIPVSLGQVFGEQVVAGALLHMQSAEYIEAASAPPHPRSPFVLVPVAA